MKRFIDGYRMYGIKKLFGYLVSEIYMRLWMQPVRRSYSQLGEDLVIDKLLGKRKKGFYVDIGANDPVRFNNSMKFYRRGWRGINIEPNADLFRKLTRARSGDINLNCGVGRRGGDLTFYRFIPDTLSTFSKEDANKYIGQGFILQDKVKVEVVKLSEVLDKYAVKKKIDFMSVDTEGYDLEVLRSNNWNRHKPKVVCVESVNSNEAGEMLKKKGYVLKHRTPINAIYMLD